MAKPEVKSFDYLRGIKPWFYFRRYGGVIQVASCPKNFGDGVIDRQCRNEDTKDLLRMLPVYDFLTKITYRNIFCAMCNDARNTSFWIIEPGTCPHDFSSYCRNRRWDRILDCYTRKCSFSFSYKRLFSKERLLLKELVL